ncbi:6,7-dimethyl-8-ribityllumazine synthase [Paracoccus halophilus]|uniref:6,7-dimethyl-8-ribityllumazine synthase n=1 Tax=Paracoccus halophilus TaxID=376733 RepID=A0A099F6M6_9RHOB|nr:6,7-dimethyl-8-ribityllumazine synthase [Paracoccus halophilus]KGJ06099.1 6,7-dimethyl-8-ribityllumazine synthase [Paracoccus halophilus]SFA46303.1 6,7-dimethyl-8-ribityllumazine synthase [Paracoccus halophilus]
MAASIEHYQLPLPRLEGAVRLLIVVAPYYRQIADDLIAGARATAAAAGATVDLVEVPGALEIPSAIAMAASRRLYDGYVALGCVIRGETTHYDTVCNDSSRGITLLGLQGHCIGNGILTVENTEQAVVRADPQGQNKGGGAAAAALHLIALKRGWESRSPGKDSATPRDPIRLAGEIDGPAGA